MTNPLAELLDLDAEVLPCHLPDVTAWVAQVAGDRPLRRLLDLGAGTGTGTVALLQRFPAAEVTALDLSAELLERLRRTVERRSLADRVRAVQADLDAPWPALEPVDLVWASSSLHHLADPDAALAQVHDLLRPGGLLAVVEMDAFPRFLPAELGHGLEERCHALLAAARAEHVPHQGSDWGHRLSQTFTLESERVFEVEVAVDGPAGRRYVELSLGRLRAGLAERLDAADLAALDWLLGDGPDGVRRRDDLAVRSSRRAWVLSRP